MITADGRFYGVTLKVQKKKIKKKCETHRERAKSDMLTNKAGGLRTLLDVSKEEEENRRQTRPPRGATSQGTAFFP